MENAAGRTETRYAATGLKVTAVPGMFNILWKMDYSRKLIHFTVAAFAAAAELTVEGAANLATVSLEVKQPMARAESNTKVPRVDHGHREIVVVLRVIVEGRKPIAV